MRVIVGTIAVLGLAVTVAVAQPPARERAATFKPPEAVPPGELPVARGVADNLPSSPYLATTPVQRSGAPPRQPGVAGPGIAGPAWVTGVDPNLLPAAGLGLRNGSNSNPVRTLTPPPTAMTKNEMPVQPAVVQPKILDRLKGAVTGDKPAPKALPQPVMQPAQPEVPTASTPFRGTGVNGAPVFAGPPAYRWYGWGTITPGANPLAPTGHYPKASANWYQITGATPGAFPVPVSNPGQTAPGIDPPNYGQSTSRPQQPVVPISTPPQPQPSLPYLPDTSKPVPPLPTGSKFGPGPAPTFIPSPTPAPVSVPTMTAPPTVPPAGAAPPVVPPPAMPIPPAPAATLPPLPPVPPVTPAPTVAPAKAPAVAPPVAPAVPVVPSVEPMKVPLPSVEPKPLEVAPSPLPTSVTENPPREEQKWEPGDGSSPPPPGTWTPAPDAAPPQGTNSSWKTGGATVKPAVARAQLGDNTPDPIATLVQQMCQGRATGVEVRHTGTKKVQVCFEIRGADAAQKLVADISKRPELTAYQIDFCVVVK